MYNVINIGSVVIIVIDIVNTILVVTVINITMSFINIGTIIITVMNIVNTAILVVRVIIHTSFFFHCACTFIIIIMIMIIIIKDEKSFGQVPQPGARVWWWVSWISSHLDNGFIVMSCDKDMMRYYDKIW